MSIAVDDFDPFVPGLARSISLVQASGILKVSRRTLYYWIKQGRIQTIRTALGSQRVLVDSVRLRWLERF